jgi:FkbM family methyltransferase
MITTRARWLRLGGQNGDSRLEKNSMSVIRSTVRSAVLRCAPGLAHAYRLMRDRRVAAVQTSFGFTLAGNKRLANGRHEEAEIGVFLGLVNRASVCVDIGANIGLYTCIAASRGKHVLAVEPLARNLELLYRNIEANNFTEVEVFPLGLTSRTGVERIYGFGTGASLVQGWAGSLSNSYKLVAVSKLDLILSSRFEGLPLLIKMDVEGFELEVLKGAEQTLRMIPRPKWIVEICLNEHFPGGRNDNFCETFETFWRRGYKARIVDSEQRVVEQADVLRWARQGHVDFGSHNYLFC